MIKKITVIAALIFLAACTTPAEQNQHFLKGNELLANNQYSGALEQFKLAINDNVFDAAAYIAAADILISKGQYEDALQILTVASEQAQGKQVVFERMGKLKLLTNNLDESLAFYDQALAIDPNMREGILGKVKVLALQEANEDLITYLSGLSLVESDHELQILRAIAEIDDLEKAKTDIDKAAGSDGQIGEIAARLKEYIYLLDKPETKLFNLAQICFQVLSNGWNENAFPLTSKMIKENEFYENGYIYRGIILLKLGRADEAIENLLKGQNLNPKDEATKVLLAQAYFLKNDTENGPKQVRAVTVFTEKNIIEILQLLADNDQFALTDEFIAKYQALDVRNLPLVKLAELKIYIEAGNYTKAKEVADILLPVADQFEFSKQAEAYALIGFANFKSGNKADGIEQIKKSQSLDRNNPLGYLYEAELLIDQSQFDGARSALERAIDLDFSGKIAIEAQKLLNEL